MVTTSPVRTAVGEGPSRPPTRLGKSCTCSPVVRLNTARRPLTPVLTCTVSSEPTLTRLVATPSARMSTEHWPCGEGGPPGSAPAICCMASCTGDDTAPGITNTAFGTCLRIHGSKWPTLANTAYDAWHPGLPQLTMP